MTRDPFRREERRFLACRKGKSGADRCSSYRDDPIQYNRGDADYQSEFVRQSVGLCVAAITTIPSTDFSEHEEIPSSATSSPRSHYKKAGRIVGNSRENLGGRRAHDILSGRVFSLNDSQHPNKGRAYHRITHSSARASAILIRSNGTSLRTRMYRAIVAVTVHWNDRDS